MATSTIKQYPQMRWSSVTINGNYTTSANNHIETEKWGSVCMITGYFNNTVQIPAYTTVFTLPSDRFPFLDFSFRILSDNENYWLFATAVNGVVSTQGTPIPVETHYITAFYMTTY